MRILSFFIILFLLPPCLDSANKKSNKSNQEAIFTHDDFAYSYQLLAQQLSNLDSTQKDDLLNVAQLFLDSVYVGKTLEIGNDSSPVINIRELDCLTFIENTVALEKSQGNQDSFIHWISNIRYLDGKPLGYASRLHYFSEWILDNTEKGWVEDVTCEIGGDTLRFNLDFMSTHPEYYPQLKQNPSTIKKIQSIEKRINNTFFCYIPKGKLKQFEYQIKDGDILGITTNVEGLDFAHNGFAVHQNNRLYMLHASSDFKRVMLTQQSLADYLSVMQHMTGIVVLRLTCKP